jgi:hypothetical protein
MTMRNTFIGLALAVVLIAGLVFLASHRDPSAQRMAERAASKIEPGFTGTKQIGAWHLACGPAQKREAPLPLSLTPFGQRGQRNESGPGLGRCRLAIGFRQKGNPKQIAELLVFRILKQNRFAVFIAVIPPVATGGDALYLRSGENGVRLNIANCDARRCVATAAIGRRGEAALLSTGDRGALVLRRKNNPPRRLLVVPLAGVDAALDAMRRAEL